MDDEKTYRFRWSNYDLNSYIDNRRQVARNLRAQAANLTLQAEQIDNEMHELRNSLAEVEAANG